MPRPLSEAARQKAIAAIQALVAELGIDGFTVDKVAKRSGVAKSTLYRHWSSAQEMLVHALDCQIEPVITPDTGSLRGDLAEMCSRMTEVLAPDDRVPLMFELLGAAFRDRDLGAVHEAMIQERTRPVRAIVQRAVDRGEIPPIDPDIAVALIEGPFMARVIMTTSTELDTDVVEALVDHIVHGLRAGQVPNE